MMRTSRHTSRLAQLALAPVVVAFSAFVVSAAPIGFSEDFAGPGLDAAWNQGGDPNGHPVAIAGTYDITDAFGNPGTKLSRNTGGTLGAYTHEIKVSIAPFAGSGTDFKWKSFGPDGFMEIVLNSFGDMRLFQTGGSLVSNTPIGYTDGDDLELSVSYFPGTDTMDVTYAINGAPAVLFYSGTGNGGSLGNVITNFVEVELFKFGSAAPQQVASIDEWNLIAIPEPSCAILLTVACVSWFGCGTRR